MDRQIKLTPSQIRYMLCMLRLSREGCGVKNVELATALHHSKPSVHNTLRSLADMGIVAQETFGLAHFTDEGRTLAEKYDLCFSLMQDKINELCGNNIATEMAICGILVDLPPEKMDELCGTVSPPSP